MKVETKPLETQFEPFSLTIHIETRQEFDILNAIFSSSKERLCSFVKERYGKQNIPDKEIDLLTDQIYQALKFE